MRCCGVHGQAAQLQVQQRMQVRHRTGTCCRVWCWWRAPSTLRAGCWMLLPMRNCAQTAPCTYQVSAPCHCPSKHASIGQDRDQQACALPSKPATIGLLVPNPGADGAAQLDAGSYSAGRIKPSGFKHNSLDPQPTINQRKQCEAGTPQRSIMWLCVCV